jgi:hypothetical protein
MRKAGQVWIMLAGLLAGVASSAQGSAMKPQNRGRFTPSDRGHLAPHYQADAARWARRSDRPHLEAGHAILKTCDIQPVPRAYWGGAAPPADYAYGYCDGYVLSYNPTTRIIADVLDLTVAP